MPSLLCDFGKTMPDETFTVKLPGMQFLVNFKGVETSAEMIQRVQGIREPQTVEILRSAVKPGMRVIELGACFGYFTMILSRLVGGWGRILAVEPLRAYVKVIRRNLRLNQAKNVKMLNIVINNDPKYRGIYNPDGVPVKTITEVIEEEAFHPDVIFMDIEGSEAHVIKDLVGSGYLESRRPTIIWEAHSELYAGSGFWWDFNDLLMRYGYKTRHQGRHMAVAVAEAKNA